MEENTSFRRNAMLVGGIIGALVGVVAANMLVREAEEGDNESSLTPAKGFQLGMLVLGLLRQITSL
jgi:hypothetical protein